MADTEAETLPNGTGLSEEDERMKQRPADIDADVREMERRKRVEALMSSKLFREELERVLDQQMHEGNDAPLLQRIREMVGGRLHTGSLRGPSCVLPINDIRGIEGVGYEKGEKILRCKLAAVYRLVDLFGWTQTGMSGQITARLNTAVEQVLTTPRGLLPHEVTASSLVKVDMQGVVQDQGTTNFPVNVEGFSLHASVHAARPDVRCVLHIRSPAALAVSAMKRGLLPLCNEAALLGDIAYHRVPYGNLDNEERDKLVRALGPHAKVLMLTSGGALCCGATLEEAFFQARNLTAACDVQLRLASIPLDELTPLDEETRRQMYETSRKPPADAVKWRVGGEEFEALMRMLDNAGFRTGYIYRHPLVKNDVPRPKNDVEVPPAVSSLGYLLEEEELYRQGLWKKGQGKTGERTRWLNSPNVYQKVEVLETGTNDPKKITKWVDANNEEWVQDGSPAHSSTPVKIDTLQFVPKNTNPKEFKALQQQIKENRRADKISAGPQSHILEGVTWDEASKLVGEDAANTHTGDHVVLMGAASKGIIQRGYQHNATMYSAPYARNPFDHVTDREIDEYRRTVERKQRSDYDTDLSESEAVSAAQVTSPASAPSETEEESRDEHRVLRIETKQVPVRSQPEVVLSDVDPNDFLNAERAHADRTKDEERDPNLLSDDEVFLESAASTVTSSVTSPVQGPVVVRSHQTAVQHTVVRGKLTELNVLHEALSANKRTFHDYSRNCNLENAIKKFDSSDSEGKQAPKCKLSLNTRLPEARSEAEVYNPGMMSSRSSLYSIPSLEWDGRCRSLPRVRRSRHTKLYRTQSHSGFINSYMKDPEPMHYHLPRCRSCGATNSSYAWEVKDHKMNQKTPGSIYFSVDNIPQKCKEEASVVKVCEKEVPVFKVEKIDAEFVESQEFTEDNYIGDIGSSFSSDNQTVIERPVELESDTTVTEETVNGGEKTEETKENSEEIVLYRAECVTTVLNEDEVSNNEESVEGEYHSFTDEMDFEEAVYVSPVKELVEKDIRDYSVPIDFYCEDYKKEGSPGKSPQKRRDATKGVLEPILEESKSSYDDSSNLSSEKGDSNVKDESKKDSLETVEEVNEVTAVSINEGVKDYVELNEPINLTQTENKIENHDEVLDTGDVVVLSCKPEQFDENKNINKKVTRFDEGDNKHIETIQSTLQAKKDNIDQITQQITTEEQNKMEVDLPSLNKNDVTDELKASEKTSSDNIVNNVIQDLFSRAVIAGQLRIEMSTTNSKVTTELLETECSKQDGYFIAEEDSDMTTNDIDSIHTNVVQTAIDVYSELETEETESLEQQEMVDSVYLNVFEILSNEAIISTETGTNRPTSIDSVASSAIELKSFDSTAEFEKYEVITEVVAYILDKIDFDITGKDVFLDLPKPTSGHFDLELNSEPVIEATEMKNEENCEPQQVLSTDVAQSEIDVKNTDLEVTEEFSIAKMIQDIELNTNLNETILTESSDSESQSQRIVEAVTYYIFDRAFCYISAKNKSRKQKQLKRVITVVDSEDILFTASAFWLHLETFEQSPNSETKENIEVSNENIKEVEACRNGNDILENVTSLNTILDHLKVDNENSNVNRIEHPKLSTSNESICMTDVPDKNFNDLTRSSDLSFQSTLYFDNEDKMVDKTNMTNESIAEITYDEESGIYQDSFNDNFDSNHESHKLAIDILQDLLDNSLADYESCSQCKKLKQDIQCLSQTFVLEDQNDMDTAFIEADDHYSRSSSPNRETSVFEVCTESPIKNPNNTFIGDDLSVLYEKDDTLLGSPFVKKAPVISMSQIVHRGGIKYWVSFDDSLTEGLDEDRKTFRPIRKYEENKLPSFVTVDFNEGKGDTNLDKYLDAYEKDGYRRTSVLLEEFEQSDANIKTDDSYATACVSTDYNTCESDANNSKIDGEPQKKLLYDSRIDLHTKKSKRQYASWPPFEDTLFYRIISKFRMSESFDPSDFENVTFDSSL